MAKIDIENLNSVNIKYVPNSASPYCHLNSQNTKKNLSLNKNGSTTDSVKVGRQFHGDCTYVNLIKIKFCLPL